MGNLVIAVDGAAGAGKSTIAKIVAKAKYKLYRYRCYVQSSYL